ncbi:MAG: transposase [Verrucomicrobia bacterium]|nr:transposase [Verrucomicrobiota bacterium]
MVILLGLNLAIPDHTTFSRRSTGLSFPTSRTRSREPVHVVLDSTGLKVYGADEWQTEKHGERARRTWRKLHLVVNPDSGEILASELTSNEVGNPSMVGRFAGHRGAEFYHKHRPESLGLAYPVDPGERAERLGESGGRWETVAGQNRHVPLQSTHWSHAALSKVRGTADGSPDGLCGAQPQDPTRHAEFKAGSLTNQRRSLARPCLDLCTNAAH